VVVGFGVGDCCCADHFDCFFLCWSLVCEFVYEWMKADMDLDRFLVMDVAKRWCIVYSFGVNVIFSKFFFYVLSQRYVLDDISCLCCMVCMVFFRRSL